MRVLSLWQPWATLCVSSDPTTGRPPKEYETRGWSPVVKVRGLQLPIDVAIHATKRTVELRALEYHEPAIGEYGTVFRNALRDLGFTPRTVPLGAIIGVARIVKLYHTETIAAWAAAGGVDQREIVFGDYSPGRFAFQLAEAIPLREPIPFKGRQEALYLVPPEVQARIDSQLQAAQS